MKAPSPTAAVVGAGSWGTALALHLSRAGFSVRLWGHDSGRLEAVRQARENETYLPGFSLPEAIHLTSDLTEAMVGCPLVLWATPARHLRELVRQASPSLAMDARLVIATKGIEEGTGLRMSEVVREASGLPNERILVLSGPSFAKEVARGDPTTGVLACAALVEAERLQERISHDAFRLYANSDVVGVEMGGSLKNVMALAAGVVEGLGLGHNTAAALMTRGLSEMTRLGVACGGRPSTFAGLAGMGDLVLTCTGRLSRNRGVGVELGKGRPLSDVLAGMNMVAEGVSTTSAALLLADRKGVEMPITQSVDRVLRGVIGPRQAVTELLNRPLKVEESWGSVR